MSNHIEHIIKMKKAILTLAVLCGIGMTAMAQTDIQNDTAIFPYDMFLAPEHLPEFIGGKDSLYAFLKKNVHYPKEAIEKKVEGKVFVSFIVEKTAVSPMPKLCETSFTAVKRLTVWQQNLAVVPRLSV